MILVLCTSLCTLCTFQRQAFLDFDSEAVHFECTATNASICQSQTFEFALVPCPKMATVEVDPDSFSEHFIKVIRGVL